MQEPSPDEGASLMAAVLREEPGAFRALYDTYGARIMRFLYRLGGNRQLAEDWTQDTFVKAWRAARSWDADRGRVSTWLFTIARRHAWNELEKRHRRRRIRGTASTFADVFGGPDLQAAGPAEAADLRRVLEAALERLTPRLRLVFVLLRLEGLSLAETAEIADVPVGTVKSRAAAAEQALRRLLAGEGPAA